MKNASHSQRRRVREVISSYTAWSHLTPSVELRARHSARGYRRPVAIGIARPTSMLSRRPSAPTHVRAGSGKRQDSHAMPGGDPRSSELLAGRFRRTAWRATQRACRDLDPAGASTPAVAGRCPSQLSLQPNARWRESDDHPAEPPAIVSRPNAPAHLRARHSIWGYPRPVARAIARTTGCSWRPTGAAYVRLPAVQRVDCEERTPPRSRASFLARPRARRGGAWRTT